MVASEDGYLYVYNMDGNEGGDLTLYKQHRLGGRPEEASQTDGPHRSEPQPINSDGGNMSESLRIRVLVLQLIIVYN